VALAVCAVTFLAACGSSEPTVVGTLEGVGDLPGPLTSDRGIGSAGGVDRAEIIAARAETGMSTLITGSQVLVIGDSIFASAASRYGGEICGALTPLGWNVEVNAEVGRFVDFGERVLQRRLRPASGVDWDAIVISLGSNFGGDLSAYRTRLIRILDQVAPRPVLLFTVSEFLPDRIKLNDVIVEMVRMYPNVFVVEWSAIVARDSSLLQRDRLHLTQAGRDRMVQEMARALGTHSTTQPGRCLPTEFTDDSAITGSEDASIITPPTTTSNGGSSGTTSTSTSTTAPEPDDADDPVESDPEDGDPVEDTGPTTTIDS
jgi:lysophospholipase L1-like esterase